MSENRALQKASEQALARIAEQRLAEAIGREIEVVAPREPRTWNIGPDPQDDAPSITAALSTGVRSGDTIQLYRGDFELPARIDRPDNVHLIGWISDAWGEDFISTLTGECRIGARGWTVAAAHLAAKLTLTADTHLEWLLLTDLELGSLVVDAPGAVVRAEQGRVWAEVRAGTFEVGQARLGGLPCWVAGLWRATQWAWSLA